MTSKFCLPKLKLKSNRHSKIHSDSIICNGDSSKSNSQDETQTWSHEENKDTVVEGRTYVELTSPKLKRNESFKFRLSFARYNKKGNSRRHKPKYKVKYQKVYGEDDGAYKNCSLPRGKIFVFNFETFDGHHYPKREGSDLDFINIIDVLNQMGYGNSSTEDQFCFSGHITKETFMKRIKEFSQLVSHKDHDSCIIVIMSHGCNEKAFASSDNNEINLEDVYALFENVKCPNLAGKPKLFILQYCRNASDIRNSSREYRQRIKLEEERKIIKYKKELENKVSEKIKHLQLNYANNMKVLNTHLAEIKRLSGIEDDSLIELRSPKFFVEEPIPSEARLSSFARNCDTAADECSILLKDTSSQSLTNEDMTSQNVFTFTQSGVLKLSNDQEFSESNQPGSHETNVTDDSKYDTDGRAITNCNECPNYQRLSDIYIIYSTSAGDHSFRDTKNGSLLIQSLCHTLAEDAFQSDIDTIVRKASVYMREVLQKNDHQAIPRQTCERRNIGFDKMFYFNPIKTAWKRSKSL